MDESETGIYAREVGDVGVVQIGIASGRVISLSIPDAPSEEATREHALLDRIEDYIDGEPDDFEDVPIALTVPTDHRAVLERVCEIPYGETTDVASLARRTPGFDEDDENAVRTALEANPVPILIPSHRIVDGPDVLPGGLDRGLRAIEAGG
ncbi:MGMT family protein [Halalkalicoccus jeotgali]|uniref:Methylated-DNA--protein-cysteine methyltransferase n=1 Tax=Halalkalicoccus jeotgali (strain DSM 18796 / CECT 7217 / JCM 14584 / KCTC 4019 / B3) TaxID=795797 RepID=D8J8J3_HALJB|nr:MGMT family protein [Halalkalicoccus jeotgali]ADJ16239.1 methylated-DNA--protein-cysteine methyltransferase [Halalkalicoccus jeotgali B3]ELY36974.1 methylated-DNA--protein-cysteine methyltransferase [Halalkalicoccus jeotgali B3]